MQLIMFIIRLFHRKLSISRPFKRILTRRRLQSTISIDPLAYDTEEVQLSSAGATHNPLSAQQSTPLEIQEFKSQPYKYAYNIILIGDSNVGKSCFERFLSRQRIQFLPAKHASSRFPNCLHPNRRQQSRH